jgi:hypothetical protein
MEFTLSKVEGFEMTRVGNHRDCLNVISTEGRNLVFWRRIVR